ncbi:MAG: dihydrolipoamide acetyltransferase family protein [Waddliaceae bacterium]
MDNIVTVPLPDIGEGVVEGEVMEWLKQEGDRLEKDEPVVIVMTDKATVELPSPYAGILAKQYYQQGEIAIRDEPLYAIDVEEQIRQEEPSIQRQEEVAAREELPLQRQQKISSSGRKALATPATRKLAKEMGIDLTRVEGTGKGGRVTVKDLRGRQIQRAAPIIRMPGDIKQPLKGVPRLMAKKMAESKRTAAHFSYHERVEAARLIQLRESFQKEGKREKVHITYTPFLIKALSMTIVQFPLLNSMLDVETNTLILHTKHHVGIAMSTTLGLIVPVLKDVQEMALPDLIRNFESLKAKAFAGKLQRSDMKEATITISNFGSLGEGLWATPVINYPEVAILAVNKIQKQPHVINSNLVVAEMMNLSWSFDHRVIDGELAAKISHYFAMLIENPVQLLS